MDFCDHPGDSQADSRASCKFLHAQDDSLRASQASRGDAATMKILRDLRSGIDEKLRAAKC